MSFNFERLSIGLPAGTPSMNINGRPVRRREFLEFYSPNRLSQTETRWKGIQLAGIKDSIIEVNEAAWALLEEICGDQSLIMLGTMTILPGLGQEKLEEIVLRVLAFEQKNKPNAHENPFAYGLPPQNDDLNILDMKSGSCWVKHRHDINEWQGRMSFSGIYIHRLFTESLVRKVFIMYPVIMDDEAEEVKAEIYDWIVQLPTTLLRLMLVENPKAKASGTQSTSSMRWMNSRTLQYQWHFGKNFRQEWWASSKKKATDLKILTQHFRTNIEQGTHTNISKHRSLSWHQVRSIIIHKPKLQNPASTLRPSLETEEEERRLSDFILTALSSCEQQAVRPATFKALLDEVQRDNRAKAAGKRIPIIGPVARADYMTAHSAAWKFAELIGTLGNVLFLGDQQLDSEFEAFVKKLAEDTLPQYKSQGYWLELLESFAKQSFQKEFNVFKKAYTSKMLPFLSFNAAVEGKFHDIERKMQSAWEGGTLKDFVVSLPKLYAFDLTRLRMQNEDKLIPQFQLSMVIRHDYHEDCVRSAVQTLERLSQNLESDFPDHFMNPEGVPLPKKVNHSETKGSYKVIESLASLVRTALDKKYARLLEASEARIASIEEQLARNKRELREKELAALKEQLRLGQNQWNGMAIKRE